MSNVIVFMSDEHNPRYASPYGHDFILTPHLQTLADTGTLFENAYCPSPLCVPSRSAFLSGKRVHEVSAYGNNRIGIPEETHGIGKVMADAGVHSVFIGKTHAYRPISELGFSEVLLPSGDKDVAFDEAQQRKPLAVRHGSARRETMYGPREAPWGRDEDYTQAAVDWLLNTAGRVSEPWVLYINLLKPHFPHFCSQELWDLYADHADLPDYGPDTETGQHPYSQDLRVHFELDGFDESHVRGQRRGYYACITFIDQQVGRIMAALQQAHLVDTTNLIYTSDHGEMLGKFGLWWKCNLLEDAAGIPCIAAGPDFGHRTVSTPVDLHDVQASVMSLTGAGLVGDRLGTPLNLIDAADHNRFVFAEYHGHGTRASSYMVRQGDWKLIHHIGAEDQLFNLRSDPDELSNACSSEPERVAALMKILRTVCDPEQEQRAVEAAWVKQVRLNEASGS
ncbi:MAG: sulfatase-like hydrolase/transferase [Pseudomonadota bacterium]